MENSDMKQYHRSFHSWQVTKCRWDTLDPSKSDPSRAQNNIQQPDICDQYTYVSGDSGQNNRRWLNQTVMKEAHSLMWLICRSGVENLTSMVCSEIQAAHCLTPCKVGQIATK